MFDPEWKEFTQVSEPSAPALQWRTSSLCDANGCVEVARYPDGTVGVRDSKRAGGPVLRYQGAEWSSFIAAVKRSEFDAG